MTLQGITIDEGQAKQSLNELEDVEDELGDNFTFDGFEQALAYNDMVDDDVSQDELNSASPWRDMSTVVDVLPVGNFDDESDNDSIMESTEEEPEETGDEDYLMTDKIDTSDAVSPSASSESSIGDQSEQVLHKRLTGRSDHNYYDP